MRHCVKKKIKKSYIEMSLIRALILHGQIKTTLIRAKRVRPAFERLITKGKKVLLSEGDIRLSKMRDLASDLHSFDMAKLLIDNVCPVMANRPGGYLRIVKHSCARLGDSARVATIGLVVGQ
jgi:large subunit ribosomal protein L17